MLATHIRNASTSAIVYGYGVAPFKLEDKAGESHEKWVVVWLDLAPSHPKILGALWAGLVLGEALTLIRPEGENLIVYGLHRRYKKLTAEAPELNVGRLKARLTRLIAPEACQMSRPDKPFVVLEWPNASMGVTLAAMLERGTACPIQLAWGDYLLAEAVAQGYARPLATGGAAPQGYLIEPAPWAEIVGAGLKNGRIVLAAPDAGQVCIPVAPDSIFARQSALEMAQP